MFYYIDLLENKVKVYDSQSGQITVMNLFWVEGEITNLYPATVNDEPVFYVVAGSRYLITPEIMGE